MNEFEDWFGNQAHFTHRFAIYLPSCEKDGSAIDGFEDLANSTSRMLCDLFGGVTSYPAKGLFQRQSGIPQSEEILVMESFSDVESWSRHSKFLRAWTGVLAEFLQQESIACSLDGKMCFVQPTTVRGGDVKIGDYEAVKRVVLDQLNGNGDC